LLDQLPDLAMVAHRFASPGFPGSGKVQLVDIAFLTLHQMEGGMGLALGAMTMGLATAKVTQGKAAAEEARGVGDLGQAGTPTTLKTGEVGAGQWAFQS
jgi:hypothetical protein